MSVSGPEVEAVLGEQPLVLEFRSAEGAVRYVRFDAFEKIVALVTPGVPGRESALKVLKQINSEIEAMADG